MYDRKALFVRATKEGDADFAAFGQAVLYVDVNRDGDTLLFRTHHLRDVAWVENAEGHIDTVHRKWKPTARDLVFDFQNNVHSAVSSELEHGKDPFRTFEVRHVMVPTERVSDVPEREKEFKFRSYFIDVENQHVIEEAPARLLKYVIPRWQTVSGSPYAYSPAAIAALPDARMIQAMTYSLLDATEKAVQPPMIGQANMIKSDIELWSGGFTWVDAEYDERLGEALRPVELDFRGLPAGVQAAQNAQEMIAEAFFLNKLALPPATRDMTAFETSQRIQEYIRQALPLFEPMEAEYIGQLMEMCRSNLKNIANIRDAYSTIMTNNLNNVVKLLTSLTVILMVPTLISSLYGMNVKLPFAESPIAFVGILIFTFLLSLLILAIFIRKRFF
ncbi:hypothetical protein LCGC14_2491250, partial [marine sediment metagenome]